MSQAVIENPIINSPFSVPERHFRFTEEGITDEIVADRRSSSYFIPIARPKKKGKQLQFETEWTRDRIEENRFVNQVRERVKLWRNGGYIGITSTTRRLLDYWTESERERKLFFCQIEALETLIYITEVASKYGDAWISNDLRTANDTSNPGLPRVSSKMATGSGKTVVMAMVIAWQSLNKMANSQDARFSDAFLIVTPGITIRDRLRVLWPNDPENYYRKLNIVTAEQLEQLQQAKIIITNFHTFQLRETVKAGKLTKSILGQGERGLFTETPDQMVRRVCRQLGEKDWYDVFYQTRRDVGLFGENVITEKVGSFDLIGQYFVERLKTSFAGVAENPLSMPNSRNVPLYLLCFASGNPKGAKTAVKIAQDILKRKTDGY